MRLHFAALIILFGVVSCAKQNVRDGEVLYNGGFDSQYVSSFSQQIGVAYGKADEFVADDVVIRILDQANWSDVGTIVKWSSDTAKKWWLTSGGSSARLLIYFPSDRIVGDWDVGIGSTNAIAVLVAGRYKAEQNPMCAGIASKGRVVVGEAKKKLLVSVNARFDMASVGFGRKDCASRIDFQKDVEVQ